MTSAPQKKVQIPITCIKAFWSRASLQQQNLEMMFYGVIYHWIKPKFKTGVPLNLSLKKLTKPIYTK